MKDQATAVVHLASQVICDVWLFKARKESHLNKTLSHAEVAKLYADNMQDAGDDEDARNAPSTIEAAIVIYEKVLSLPQLRKIIEQLESQLDAHSPFNSIAKLLEIYYKCKNSAKLEWFFTLSTIS